MTGEGSPTVLSEQYPEEGREIEGAIPQPGILAVVARRAGRGANAFAVCLVIGLAATFVYEVIARLFFNSPTGFANQLAAYSMPFIALLAAARTLERNGHVTVDAFVLMLSRKSRARLEVVTEALSVVLILAITGIVFAVVLESWRSGYKAFSTAFTFPEYIPQMVMPIGLSLLALQQVARFVDCVRRLRSGEPEGTA